MMTKKSLESLAPKMARMLFELEWAAGDDRGDACPSCLFQPREGHAPDCKLREILVAIEAAGSEKES